MRASPRLQIGGMLAAILVSGPIGRWAWNRATAPRPPVRSAAIIAAMTARVAVTPSANALRDAGLAWILAQQAVARELERQPEWSPDEVSGHIPDYYRQRLMALDRSGDLAHARLTDQRALALARTPAETYRATMLMARLEYDSGHHLAELRYARILIGLAPQRRNSLDALRHAAICNGLVPAPPQSTDAPTGTCARSPR